MSSAKPAMKLRTFYIPDAIYEALREQALANDQPISALVRRALIRYLDSAYGNHHRSTPLADTHQHQAQPVTPKVGDFPMGSTTADVEFPIR